jgi:hypothetical protein
MPMEPTVKKVYTMKLNGMAQAFKEQLHHPTANEVSLDERFSLLGDHQRTWQGRARDEKAPTKCQN